ncbi:heme uptake protein IsdC [uncultured Clostridium sp.]|uniref:NEAT domain-containing protein n=1 Tax=uncultured Clostridium sp. TaxID=59620 RepID=UPI0008222301|nr:NEAT domain-containing protein [uncultured Clostridium sp.]SCJ71068.1 heme uptake protein IsdC [uncultured Clostridium sp.]
MIRKKICIMLAAMLVTTTVLGSQQVTVNASTLNNLDIVSTESASAAETLEDGTYTIINDAFKVGTTEDSGIRDYIDTTSIVKVENEKITVTLKYTDLELETDTVRTINSITINGQEIEFVTTDEAISFEVESTDVLYSRINVNLTYYNAYIPEFIAPGGMHTVNMEMQHNGELVKVEEETEVPKVLEDGIYTITNDAFKVGTTENSGIRDYIDTTSIVKIENGKITVTLKYTDLELETDTVRIINSITINGQEVEFVTTDEAISFEVESTDVLYSRINVNLTYYNAYIPEFIAPGGMHTVNVDMLHNGELQKIENGEIPESPETPETPDVIPGAPENGDIDGSTGATQTPPSEGTGSGSTGDTQIDKTYTGKNEIVSDSEAGKAMARQAISEDMKIEKVGEKYIATITFTEFGTEQMSDVIVYVNGKKVETKEVRTTLAGLSFELDSLSDSIEISTKISAMGGRRISFGIKVLENSLIEVENGDEGTTGGTTGETTGGTISGTTGETTGGTTNTDEETKATIGKLYSIQNNVIHESETGVAMARMYLNSTSKVEEIEGKYYVTLTFTGSEFMQNHEIYVNGSKVNVSKSTSGDETYVRFAVGSLTDSIKVKTYVVPMAREVEFDVELLIDTLTFIKEYTVETLPNTGAATSSVAVAGLGLILTSAGAVLTKKKK